jgi:hypothetical protein
MTVARAFTKLKEPLSLSDEGAMLSFWFAFLKGYHDKSMAAMLDDVTKAKENLLIMPSE